MSNSRIIGVFDNEDKLLSSVRRLKSSGYDIHDVISPYPIHEVFDELRLKSRIPLAAFIYGTVAFFVTFGFLYWSSVINYPLVFGGKPQNTLSFVIVIFVAIVFVTIFMTIVTFFLAEKKGPGAKQHFKFPGITDDRFVIIVGQPEDKPADSLRELLHDSGAIEITEQDSIDKNKEK